MNFNFKSLKLFLVTFFVFIILDATAGKYIYKKFVREQLKDKNPNFSKYDEYFDHKFPKNFDAIGGWGNFRYKLCTDNNGFRSTCNNKNPTSKTFDLAFIGDSFTEGLGYDYEKTFVGIIEKELSNKSIANLSMSSYSPSIYYTKIKKLILDGYKFNELIVFLDLSDLADDVLCYQVKDNEKVVRRNTFKTCFKDFNAKEKNKISQLIERHLKFTNIFLNLVNKTIFKPNGEKDIRFLNVINHSRSEWTYNYKKNLYNNLELNETSEISRKHMENLFELLNENSIELSIAVYPWPGTLKNDQVENIHVKLWKKFCEDRCKKFYNFMPIFFDNFEGKNFYDTYKKFYIENDFHFNAYGNEFIAKSFLEEYIKN